MRGPHVAEGETARSCSGSLSSVAAKHLSFPTIIGAFDDMWLRLEDQREETARPMKSDVEDEWQESNGFGRHAVP